MRYSSHGFNVVHDGEDKITPDALVCRCLDARQAERIAQLLNAEEIALRRGWYARLFLSSLGIVPGSGWQVFSGIHGFIKQSNDSVAGAASPSAALCAAEEWFVANVEAVK
jgi:hypothetical protein